MSSGTLCVTSTSVMYDAWIVSTVVTKMSPNLAPFGTEYSGTVFCQSTHA